METNTRNQSAPSASTQLPRAVWIGGGVLCLAVAALAGALVTKSIDAPRSSAAAPSTSSQPDTTAKVGTPVPSGAMPQDEVAPPARSAVAAVQPGTSVTPAAPVAAVPAPATTAPVPPPARVAQAAPCTSCGTVESVRTVKLKGEGTGVGAVAGGVLGGVVGNQFGHGNGKAAMTVLGAVGGGFAGNEVERRTRTETRFDVTVRMRDGSRRVIRETEPIAVGARVVVEGNRLRVTSG